MLTNQPTTTTTTNLVVWQQVDGAEVGHNGSHRKQCQAGGELDQKAVEVEGAEGALLNRLDVNPVLVQQRAPLGRSKKEWR